MTLENSQTTNSPTITVVPTIYLERADDRKDLALKYTLGAGATMTAYAAWAMWLVRAEPAFVFWMGIAALAIIAIIFTGILGLLVKRSINLSKEGLVITDDNYKS